MTKNIKMPVFRITPACYVLIMLLWVLLFQAGCNKEDAAVKDPVYIVTNVYDGESFEKGAGTMISVDVNTEAVIHQVRILIDQSEKAASDSIPFNFQWNTSNEYEGNHLVTLVVTTLDQRAVSRDVGVRIYVVNTNPCPGKPTVTDYDGNTYNTIQIGNQCWMKENLKAIHYFDGTPLIDGTGAGNTQYDTLTKYYFNYNDDESHVETYGRLYIWMAAVNGYSSEADLNPSQIQGVCPAGWHLPSDSEWRELEMFLGMAEDEAKDREWRGTIEGGMLKEQGTGHWESPNKASTNESGFTALPAGHRNLSGDFFSMGKKASFWSSTNHIAVNNTQNPAFRLLHHNESRTYRYQGFHGYLTYARSVRCVKDK